MKDNNVVVRVNRLLKSNCLYISAHRDPILLKRKLIRLTFNWHWCNRSDEPADRYLHASRQILTAHRWHRWRDATRRGDGVSWTWLVECCQPIASDRDSAVDCKKDTNYAANVVIIVALATAMTRNFNRTVLWSVALINRPVHQAGRRGQRSVTDFDQLWLWSDCIVLFCNE